MLKETDRASPTCKDRRGKRLMKFSEASMFVSVLFIIFRSLAFLSVFL